jgi:signal transduction histidine kinase/CheY-like chemotaxis protein
MPTTKGSEPVPALQGVTAEQMLAAQPLPAWICAADGMTVLAANRAAAEHLGCAPEVLRGHRLFESRAGTHALSAWSEVVGAETESLQLILRPGGGTVATRLAVAPLAGGTLLLVTALPSPPAPAIQLRRSEDELLRDAKRESLELLAGGVAHDFNNLLTALLGNLNLARMDTSLSDEVQEWLEEAEKATGRARDLTHQLLAFAKGGEPVRRLVALANCLREAALFARQGSKVRCEFDLAADLWPAEVDAGQIGQIINNLVLNAVQAMPRGGIVQVSARNVPRESAHQLGLGSSHFVEIAVSDNGPGIKPEDMARIFQPYFTTKSTGSGLGLATSQTIARRHYGALRVQSGTGRGATFLLYLPAKPGMAVDAADESAELPVLSGRVLFMDDEPSIRQMAPNLLHRLGFETEVVGDGREAIELYGRALREGCRFDVVILDLTVPAGIGGLEAIQWLRELDPKVQVLVSSGYADDPVLLNYRQHGFCGTVTKPYCLAELAKVLANVFKGDQRKVPG